VLTGYTFVCNVYSSSVYDAGAESKVYLVQASGSPPPGSVEWYDVEKLPEKTVASHRDKILPAAVAKFIRKEQ
jgi:hypothetical protein